MLGNGSNKNVARVVKLFENIYGDTAGAVLNISPASLILLGDHTHYNDGVLISACVDRYWIFLVKKRKDREINILTVDSDEIVNFSLDDIDGSNKDNLKLLKGLLKHLNNEEDVLKVGFDCVVSTSVPENLGLGSSAARQVGFMNAIRRLYSLEMTDEQLLEIVRKNDLEIIGKISNIAHYYTVQFGKEKKLFTIDLRTKEHKTISLQDEDYSIIICDTCENIVEPQKICNERIEECEIGVKGLRLYIWGIKNLRDVGSDFLLRHYHMLPRRIFSRVLYNVKERTRTEEAIKHLRKKSMVEFGKLITQSHWSLSEDYDLPPEESNFIVKEASKISGVIASKMISCSPIKSTFHFVHNEAVELFTETIKEAYERKYNKSLKIVVLKLTSGVKKLSPKEFEFSNQ
jgi:galactokinase